MGVAGDRAPCGSTASPCWRGSRNSRSPPDHRTGTCSASQLSPACAGSRCCCCTGACISSRGTSPGSTCCSSPAPSSTGGRLRRSTAQCDSSRSSHSWLPATREDDIFPPSSSFLRRTPLRTCTAQTETTLYILRSGSGLGAFIGTGIRRNVASFRLED